MSASYDNGWFFGGKVEIRIYSRQKNVQQIWQLHTIEFRLAKFLIFQNIFLFLFSHTLNYVYVKKCFIDTQNTTSISSVSFPQSFNKLISILIAENSLGYLLKVLNGIHNEFDVLGCLLYLSIGKCSMLLWQPEFGTKQTVFEFNTRRFLSNLNCVWFQHKTKMPACLPASTFNSFRNASDESTMSDWKNIKFRWNLKYIFFLPQIGKNRRDKKRWMKKCGSGC